MDRVLLRRIAISLLSQEDLFLVDNCTNKEKKFNEAFKRMKLVEAKIQTLSFNFCKPPLSSMEQPKIINADWLLEIGLLHIYLDCYLIYEVFDKDEFFSKDEEKMKVIKKFRNKRLSHIEDFKVDNKSMKELISDIKYMTDLISKYMCELINEESPSNEHQLIIYQNTSGELIYTSTIKQCTHSHLDDLYKYYYSCFKI